MNNCLNYVQMHWNSRCVLCDGSEAHAGICQACRKELTGPGPVSCPLCARPLPQPAVCGACLKRPPYYDATVAACAYRFPVDALIQRFKYSGQLSLAPVLAGLLADHVESRPDLLIAMPLASSRLRERGYNQAHELAHVIGRRTDVPIWANACRRVRDTPPQALLPWNERPRNVRGAFVCDGPVAGLHVALVDDVMTTGATLNELARVVKRAGAARITNFVIARTAPSRFD